MPLEPTFTEASKNMAEDQIRAQNPATGETLEPPYPVASFHEVDAAAEEAEKAFHIYREVPPEKRATFLELISQGLERRRSTIVERAQLESGLPEARLQGELDRTAGQLRLFARELRLGIHQDVRIDTGRGDDGSTVPDIRQRHVALGPVVVFGASNFPLAFSTAGGDTASALAAGCPVVVKAHNAHPGTADLVAQVVMEAVEASALPKGTFAQIFGDGQTVGQRLAAHPCIKAVGFTGSRRAGTALMKTAASRRNPIPVYAEMSSINPVLIMPNAVAKNPEELAEGFVASLTLGAGQFCTNPGLVFVPVADENFTNAASERIAASTGVTMLTAGIGDAYGNGVTRLSSDPNIKILATGSRGETKNSPAPVIFETTAEYFLHTAEALQEEIFGAATLFVRYRNQDELYSLVQSLQGQLTATVHAVEDDFDMATMVLPDLEDRVGRILFNGWPTGVEVNTSMVHGGPYPATSDSRVTSVGSAAIHRFQRPVSYQNVPASLLPLSLQDGNPLKLPRRIDGNLVGAPATRDSREDAGA